MGVFYIELGSDKNQRPSIEEIQKYEKILDALLILSQEEIADNSCEMEKKLKVKDVLQEYLSYSLFYSGRSSFSHIECDARGKGICTLSYGERKMNESWQRILSFRYAEKSQQIEPNSFECISIP